MDNLTEPNKSPASNARSDKQWVETCLTWLGLKGFYGVGFSSVSVTVCRRSDVPSSGKASSPEKIR